MLMTAAQHLDDPGLRPRESFFLPLDFKSVVAADGAFEGYASLFDREDLGRDMVARGAFRDSLASRGAQGVRMLFQHNPNEPIGVWDEIGEDQKGLYARGRLMPEVARAREVLALMRAGALDGLSIGFKTIRSRRDPRSGIRRLEKVDLWEISVVTFPMLPGARVSALKCRPSERELERWLMRDAGLTRTEARALMRSGFKGLAAKRDAGAGPQAGHRLAATIRAAARSLVLSAST
jgi:hypothetical protein